MAGFRQYPVVLGELSEAFYRRYPPQTLNNVWLFPAVAFVNPIPVVVDDTEAAATARLKVNEVKAKRQVKNLTNQRLWRIATVKRF